MLCCVWATSASSIRRRSGDYKVKGDAPRLRTRVGYLAEGRIWLKMSAAYRISTLYPDYRDMQPVHDALRKANPDQLLWGSDWPHPRLAENMRYDRRLLDLFNAWMPDEALRWKIWFTIQAGCMPHRRPIVSLQEIFDRLKKNAPREGRVFLKRLLD